MNISKKIAVVTGGASGLGLATSKMLINAGATVVIFDMNVNAGEQAASELGNKHCHFIQLNVCLLYTSPSPRDGLLSRMPSSA